MRCTNFWPPSSRWSWHQFLGVPNKMGRGPVVGCVVLVPQQVGQVLISFEIWYLILSGKNSISYIILVHSKCHTQIKYIIHQKRMCMKYISPSCIKYKVYPLHAGQTAHRTEELCKPVLFFSGWAPSKMCETDVEEVGKICFKGRSTFQSTVCQTCPNNWGNWSLICLLLRLHCLDSREIWPVLSNIYINLPGSQSWIPRSCGRSPSQGKC